MSYDRFILRAFLRLLHKDQNEVFNHLWQKWVEFSKLPRLRLAILPDGSKALIRPGTSDVTVIKEIYSNVYGRYFDLKTSKIIIDAGAHIGIFSIFTKDNPKIIAFEPNPENCILLHYNTLLNNLNNIMIYEYALGDREGTSKFFIPFYNTGAGSIYYQHLASNRLLLRNIREIRVTTLDSVLGYIKSTDRVGIIKIDVEGAEFGVLKGSCRTIEESKPYVVISLHNQYNRRVCINFLNNFNYRLLVENDYLYAIPKG